VNGGIEGAKQAAAAEMMHEPKDHRSVIWLVQLSLASALQICSNAVLDAVMTFQRSFKV
jgi:hypothetical protein